MMQIDPQKLLTIPDEPPPFLLPWLTHSHSLTTKLKMHAGDAHLQVLGQHWRKPQWWDKHTLQLQDEQVIHREVIVSAWQIPCWYARTILPFTTYHSNEKLFNELQHKSLGELIFNSGKIQRISMLHYAINPHSIEYHWLPDWILTNNSVLWARLSTYHIDQQFPFFLIEILLSGLEDYSC